MTLMKCIVHIRHCLRMDDDYDGFEWIQLMKYEENVLTFLRKTEKPEESLLVVICNFAAVPYMDYQVGCSVLRQI